MSSENIVERFWEHVAAQPDKVALRHKTGGRWRDVTWGRYGEIVERAAKGLVQLGFERGDRLSILSSNRPEWFFADIACMSLGGTTAPVYATSSPDQVAHVVGHSRSKFAVVEDVEQLDKVLSARERLSSLERTIVLEDLDDREDASVTSWSDLISRAEELEGARWDAARPKLDARDIATFVYTSGTSGPPRAVMLSHANIWWTCHALDSHLDIVDPPHSRALSYLPLSHIAERMVSHLVQILFGSETWFAGSIETLREDLVACEPTYFFGVPRVWEKFHAAIQERLEAEPGELKARIETALLRRALEVGRRVSEAEQDAVARGEKMADARLSGSSRAQHAVMERLVLSKARARAGLGHCKRSFSAAAPIDPGVVWFFHSLGLKIAEGYGQSETNGPTTWNPPDAVRIGTVGTALPGLDLALAEDGEILVKGGNVSPGYFGDESATAELIDERGWLHSGDIGRLDELGYLTITDRKKDLIVTSGGKNVAPQEIENKLRVRDIVSQVVVIGDARPFLCALVTLDEDEALRWAKGRGIAGDFAAIVRDERTLAEIQSAVNDVNATLARAEQIKKVRVLERDFQQETGELTPTLKVRRRQIVERYGAVIEDMYSGATPAAAIARAPVEQE
ncbi:AMP-dependent synthetase/ligase [soil metagenome]